MIYRSKSVIEHGSSYLEFAPANGKQRRLFLCYDLIINANKCTIRHTHDFMTQSHSAVFSNRSKWLSILKAL